MTSGDVQSESTRPRTSELWASIERILITSDSSCRIAGLKRKMAAFRTSFAMEELEIQLQDGQSLALMFKDVTWQALEGQARHVKPRFLYDPLREIETYRTILRPHHFSVPTFYGADVNEASERYWLFLEYVPAWRLTHHEEQLWHQAARWVAEMHVRTAQVANLPDLARQAHLLIYDSDFCQLWPKRALAYADGNGIEQAGLRTAFEDIARHYGNVVEKLSALPQTFIHGEFVGSNVLVRATAAGQEICPIDWEMAAVGPSLLDLAALTIGRWTPEQKQALTSAYSSALPTGGLGNLKPDELMRELDFCELHLALQWLGWSATWTPRPKEAQDWAHEALRLAEKIELL
jgi:Predicted phosphotransferase related to Ser/Thr protein kinases